MEPDVKAFGNVVPIIVVSMACFVATGLGARLHWRARRTERVPSRTAKSV